jgi:hypothetical protein
VPRREAGVVVVDRGEAERGDGVRDCVRMIGTEGLETGRERPMVDDEGEADRPPSDGEADRTLAGDADRPATEGEAARDGALMPWCLSFARAASS